uniref:Uncharacterized protein n=1 Tax=Favella ehrenbergii TaxID=182087 RepID=A0A7S3I3B5_9SPIT
MCLAIRKDFIRLALFEGANEHFERVCILVLLESFFFKHGLLRELASTIRTRVDGHLALKCEQTCSESSTLALPSCFVLLLPFLLGGVRVTQKFFFTVKDPALAHL